MKKEHVRSKRKEDLEAHERKGLRINDKDQHLDIDNKGAIENQSRQSVWS
ncbi:hypothetical protein LJK88_44875 [Paenibacillus sp. P26]|nr:hypothetical protein LJK88_44875 [Paenibacillus sp. P26]UUZ92200.1 hypothetical protein LJK87_43475 [Paenibacillus sp. P25]